MTIENLLIGTDKLNLDATRNMVFSDGGSLEIPEEQKRAIAQGQERFLSLFEKDIPIYGVTTGFGDSSNRSISRSKSEELQNNLIQYLLVGSGDKLPRAAAKATMIFRLHSLSQALSGVSPELLERLQLHIEKDWVPSIRCRGSLGASGDLVPLAYIAQNLIGEGTVDVSGRELPMAKVLADHDLKPYRLKAKEGLALVNGTAAMAGLSFYILPHTQYLIDLAAVSSAWLCMALNGRTDSFEPLVNQRAKNFPGQTWAAQAILSSLRSESYSSPSRIDKSQDQFEQHIQDRYSLRCAPQILGPILETQWQVEKWLDLEVNSVSDNPLIDESGDLAMGGNFYGGYIGHGMDYLKISMAHLADMLDRQLMFVVDEKSNRGLPANLVNRNGLSTEDKHLHHGLKALNQAVSAITSELVARSMPNSTLSRSAESHNQDKVSLGMSAATACYEMLDPLYTVCTYHLVALAQALDLRGVELTSGINREIYDFIRNEIPFVEKDQALGPALDQLKDGLFAKGEMAERIFR